MAAVNLPMIVNMAAEYFQAAYEMIVTWDGRAALIKPALEHQGQVDSEFTSGKITTGFLVDSVYKVLENGYSIARDEGRNKIDEYIVTKSMKKYCPYIMWC